MCTIHQRRLFPRTQRIWPEIRVEPPEDEKPDEEVFTPVNPDCLSAPELERKVKEMR